jgi:hypothetical protein
MLFSLSEISENFMNLLANTLYSTGNNTFTTFLNNSNRSLLWIALYSNFLGADLFLSSKAISFSLASNYFKLSLQSLENYLLSSSVYSKAYISLVPLLTYLLYTPNYHSILSSSDDISLLRSYF